MSGARDAEGRSVRVQACAKLNFGLRVGPLRSDGYHAIHGLFVPIDLADELELQVTPEDPERRLELRGEAEGVPADASNLALRAACAFLDAAGIAAGVRIRLRKHIPASAGMGGGSSDAGAVLRGLSALWPDAVERGPLAQLALALGADVPFFLEPRPAWVSGIGERVEPAAGLPPLCVLLVWPGEPVATREVYRALDALRGTAAPPGPSADGLPALASLREPSGRLHAEALRALLRNDLEPAAVRLCPAISRVRRRLEALGALAVGLSGSGATTYGVFEDAAAAERARVALDSREPCWARVATAAGSS